MNKQELIKKLEERRTIIGNFQGYAVWWKDVKEIFEKLDEPQKVKIPQYIADKIEHCKGSDGYSLFHAMDYCYNFKECADWLERNEEVFARAWIDGYEVEKEKRYLVRIKGIEEDNAFLNYYAPRNEWFMDSGCDMKYIRAFHTRKELEDADFGWVFDCEGIEIEEVE